MRRLMIAFVLLSLALEAPVLAQRLGEILTVEVNGRAYGSAWASAGPLGISGIAEVERVKTWKGFKGGLPVSEAQFYNIAGYTEVALRARSYRSTADCLTWGGFSTALVGLGLLTVGAVKVANSPGTPQPALGISGGILALGGILAEIVGVGQRSRNLTPASFAVQVADEYNREKTKH